MQLPKLASHEFVAALLTVKPDWTPGTPITDAEADAAGQVLLAGKLADAHDAAEARDEVIRARITKYLNTRYVSAPSAGKATDVEEVAAWRRNGIAAHAAALASDRAKAFAVADVILAGAAAAATGNPAAAAGAIAPIVAGFKAFASSGDLNAFTSLTQ